MNDNKLDSFIKQSLDGHGSTVPADMWKRIQARKDFDPFVKQNLDNHHSNVPPDMWDRILDEKDFDSHLKQKLENHVSPVPADMWLRVQHEKDFDTHIKEKLDNHSSPVPQDMWQRIHPEEKKRRPIIWWWAAAASLLLLIGIGAGLYFNRNPASDAVSQTIQTPPANGPKASNGIASSLSQPSAGSGTGQAHDSLTTHNTADNPVAKADNGIANHSDHANPTTQNNTPSSTTGNANQLKKPIVENDNQSFINKKKNNNNFKNDSNFKNIANTGHNNWRHGKGDIEENTGSPLTAITGNRTVNNLDNQQLLNSGNFNDAEKLLSLKSLIRSTLSNNRLSPGQLLHANAKMPTIVCPTLGPPQRNDWYIDAFFSPDLVQKNLQDKPFGKNIKSGMDSTIHRQISFTAGVNIVKNIGDNFLIKTGVQYSQINELFKYNSGSDTRTTTVITTRDVIVSPGDTIHIRDTSTVSQTGTLTKQTQNRYKQWDIPLIFGYEFGGNGFRLNANAGIIANIRSSYQGNMLDTAQKVIDIASYNNTGIYKTNIGLGVYLGLGILKPLNDNMDLLIEPHARFNLSNMTTDAAIFNQKNTVLGLSVGIRYKINGRGQRY